MTEVTDGIHWIKLPISIAGINLDAINTYLIRGTEGYLLVDSGWNTNDSFSTLQNYLEERGLGFGDISQIVVTHTHPDHYGMAGRIKGLSGATLAMHHLEAQSIEPRYVKMEELLHQTGQMLLSNGMPDDEMVTLRDATLNVLPYVTPAFPDINLHDGDTIATGEFTFRVAWTPGHSSGHLCLYEPEKNILLSGDHILPQITPNVSVHPQSIENPLGRYIDTLKEIRKLDIRLTLPGHGKPFSGLTKRIDTILKHHVLRNREILATLQQRPSNAYRLAKELSWNSGNKYVDLPDFHKRMAIFETLAHLEMMATEGRLDIITKNGIRYYRQK